MSSALEVSGTPTTFGSGTATVTVTDADGDTATLGFGWRVTLAAPSYLLVSGSATNATGAYTVSWGFFRRGHIIRVAGAVGRRRLEHGAHGRGPLGDVHGPAQRGVRVPGAGLRGRLLRGVERDRRGDGGAPGHAELCGRDGDRSAVGGGRGDRAVHAAGGGGRGCPVELRDRRVAGRVHDVGRPGADGHAHGVGSGTATLTATDTDGDTASLRFGWTVETDARPSFGGAIIANRTWVVGEPITGFTAPTATGGNGALLYGEDGLPDGVRLVQDTWVVEGAPTLAGTGHGGDRRVGRGQGPGRGEFRLDGGGGPLAVVRPHRLGAAVDVVGGLGGRLKQLIGFDLGGGRADHGVHAAGGTGGNGTLSYGASGLPEGVIVSPERVVSGTPLATGSGTAALTARDGDGDTVAYRFRWQVEAPGTPPADRTCRCRATRRRGRTSVVQGLYLGRNRLDKIDCVRDFLKNLPCPVECG